jgi:hypothetical protein
MQDKMMETKQKKGISSVIAGVMFIMLSVVLVTALAMIILGLTKSADLSPKLTCYDMQLNSPIAIESACYNETSRHIEVQVRRNVGMDFYSMNFVLGMSGKNTEWECGLCSTCILLGQGESRHYRFNVSDMEYTASPRLVANILGCDVHSIDVIRCQ